MSKELAIVESLSSSITGHELSDQFDGVKLVLDFPNGYSASIIRHSYSYGGKDGLYELAVVYGGEIVYDTPVTSDVLGCLDVVGVVDAALEISNLPARNVLTINWHNSNGFYSRPFNPTYFRLNPLGYLDALRKGDEMLDINVRTADGRDVTQQHM